MKARVLKAIGQLDESVDALLIANSVDPHLDQSFFYFFDVPSGLFEGSVAVAHKDGQLDVLTSPLESESAHEAARSDPTARVHTADRDQAEAMLPKLLDGAQRIGLNYQELTHSWFERLVKAFPSATWVDASAAIRKARATKDPTEIDRLRRAAEIGSEVGREIPSLLKTGTSELDVATEIEYRMNRHGASGRSFATIVAFGAHGAEPHYAPSPTTRLVPGTSIVCDFGAYHRRYASDITRSFRFGPGDREMREVHETVERAQQAAFDAIRPGVAAKDVHNAAAAVIDASPFKGRLIHGVGHSIGLAVHDGWHYGPKVDDPLREGMVFTVEPGIYLPGKGGVRIEDDVVVTHDGYELLTNAPRGYHEVPA